MSDSDKKSDTIGEITVAMQPKSLDESLQYVSELLGNLEHNPDSIRVNVSERSAERDFRQEWQTVVQDQIALLRQMLGKITTAYQQLESKIEQMKENQVSEDISEPLEVAFTGLTEIKSAFEVAIQNRLSMTQRYNFQPAALEQINPPLSSVSTHTEEEDVSLNEQEEADKALMTASQVCSGLMRDLEGLEGYMKQERLYAENAIFIDVVEFRKKQDTASIQGAAVPNGSELAGRLKGEFIVKANAMRDIVQVISTAEGFIRDRLSKRMMN